MSILIKGMEMPTSCSSCPFCFGANNICPWVREYATCKGRHKDCPLVELPPHGRLIDASEKISVQLYDDMTEDYRMVKMTIDRLLSQDWIEATAPTIIEAEEGER